MMGYDRLLSPSHLRPKLVKIRSHIPNLPYMVTQTRWHTQLQTTGPGERGGRKPRRYYSVSRLGRENMETVRWCVDVAMAD